MKKFLFAPVIYLLASCAAHTSIKPGDSEIRLLTEQIASAPDTVAYEDFWVAYLESQQPLNNIAARERYQAELSAIESGDKSCEAVDWKAVTNNNILSLTPHLSAAECYESVGQLEAANYHKNLFEFIATGILSGRSGEYSYSAFEVGSWADAEDLLTISGYEIIDSYFEFANSRNAIYRVYNVKEVGGYQVSKIYFDNARFLHRLLAIRYPFAGTSDQLYADIIQILASTDYAARHAEGIVFHAEGQYPQAEQAYLDAIVMGSISANISLGRLCLSGKTEKFAVNECAQLFVAAADLGLEEAKVYLAYIAFMGLGIDPDKELATSLLSSAEQHLKKGQAEYELYSLFASEEFNSANESGAAQFLQASANKGYPVAHFTQAIGYLEQNNYYQFEKLIQKASDSGFSPAQFFYASYLLEEKKETSGGMALLNEAAIAGNPAALFERGRITQLGAHGQPVNINQSIRDYQAAAYRNHLPAQLKMGILHSKNIIADANADIAYAWYLLCGRAGHLECITNMGYSAENGYGVEQNPTHAAQLYRLAAAEGSANSSARLAGLYEAGNGVEKDLEQAIYYYTQAAERGLASAMNKLGLIYLDSGSDSFHNYPEALHWFEQAANQNSKYGYFNQARMYEQGLGVEANLDRAMSLYEEASKRGHGIASLKIAEAYSQDDNPGKNLDQVRYYLKLATEQSDDQQLKKILENCADTEECNVSHLKQFLSGLPGE
ncbi:tetratricopeptide repeat protein [Microbulbifer sp. ZKSA002]|uniref:tetratricopeptide repeat protein n=1 Tax=Microbulbifer sp. ZKSA002 TaxID=3243388 RepID=UPI0040396684